MQLRDFVSAVGSDGYSVNFVEGLNGASVSHGKMLVQLPADTKIQLSTLLDEYSHVWNKVNGRGVNLPGDLAQVHLDLAATSSKYGTTVFSPEKNTLYHQLELANMWNSGSETLPSFVRAVPPNDIRYFIGQTREKIGFGRGYLESDCLWKVHWGRYCAPFITKQRCT